VDQQGFRVEVRVDDEHRAGRARPGLDVFDVEVIVEGALGGLVAFLGIGDFRKGGAESG